MTETREWDFYGYWNVVFGPDATPETLLDGTVGNDRVSLDEWIGLCEHEAFSAGGEWPSDDDLDRFHERALDRLCARLEGERPDVD